jgi:hypothetical protein
VQGVASSNLVVPTEKSIVKTVLFLFLSISVTVVLSVYLKKFLKSLVACN